MLAGLVSKSTQGMATLRRPSPASKIHSASARWRLGGGGAAIQHHSPLIDDLSRARPRARMDHIGECTGKLAEHLGHVGNLPINCFARDGSLTRSPVPAWMFASRNKEKVSDPATENANMRTPE
jgi:hypothetical protein